MKKLLYTLIFVLLPGLLFLVGGCAEEPTGPESDLTLDPQLSPKNQMEEPVADDLGAPEMTVTEVGKTFTISLESNPTTGYSWQAEFDPEYLELVNTGFVTDSSLIGAGGVESFEFLALKQGQVEVTMIYKRPWENGFIDKQIAVVKVLPKDN